jgi:predicted small lipoprotein YifL
VLHFSRSSISQFVLSAGLCSIAACGSDGGADGPPATTKDAAPPVAVSDAGTTPVVDAHVEAGVSNSSLAALAGSYLLRFDTYGTSSAGTLAIRSRVSLLWVTKLTVEGDHLAATERLCTQTTQQACKMGCTSASTVIDPKVISMFLPTRKFARTYTLAGDGTFSGERATALLGYDDPANGALPTTSDDVRVWDVVAGSPREGMLTSLDINTGVVDVMCQVYGVQKLVSAFTGTLLGTSPKPTFASLTLSLDGSDAAALGFEGNPLCNGAAGADFPLERAVARIVRYDAGGALDCSDLSDFDKLLPADAP